MKTSREEFLNVVNSSANHAEAARRLGVTAQSVKSRLDRISHNHHITLRKSDRTRLAALTISELEQHWKEATETYQMDEASVYFDEMCRRTEERAAVRNR